MPGLVEQLQDDALNPQIPVSTLLRKVKVAAVKLNLPDAVSWVDTELNGYREEPPEYRKAQGSTVGWNPYHGWQPIHFADGKTAELISRSDFREPIASYESLIAQSGAEGTLLLELREEVVALLNQSFNFDVPRVANRVARGVIVGLVERVRNMVLDWALELSRAGITGDGLTFTSEEKQKASTSHISIGTFHGSFNTGDASGQNARVNQASTDLSENYTGDSSLFEAIRKEIKAKVEDTVVRQKLLDATNSMSDANDGNSFLSAYQKFIQAAANHMTIVAPFLPALGALVPS